MKGRVEGVLIALHDFCLLSALQTVMAAASANGTPDMSAISAGLWIIPESTGDKRYLHPTPPFFALNLEDC